MVKFLIILVSAAIMVAAFSRFQREDTNDISAQSLASHPPESAVLVETKLLAEDRQTLPEPEGLLDASEQRQLQQIQFRFHAGDYGATLVLIEGLLAAQATTGSFRLWLRAQLPVVLVSKGWMLVGLADCERAIDLFERSESLLQTPEAKKGLGYCHHRQGRFFEAEDALAAYLRQSPQDFDMQMIYSDVLESRSRYREATQALESALAAYDAREHSNVGREQISARLDSMRARASEGDWQVMTASYYFQVSHHQGEDPAFVLQVLEALDATVDWLVDDYGFTRPGQLIEVVLYRAENFSQMVVHGPKWAAAIFDGRMRVPVPTGARDPSDVQRLVRVLRHELVHAMFAQMLSGRQLPDWFNEGLAQRLECGPEGHCGSLSFPAAPGEFLAEDAFKQRFSEFSALQARAAYLQSLMLVLTLEKDLGQHDTLRRLVSSIGRRGGVSSDEMLQVLGTDFSSLHRRAARNWAQTRRFTY